MKTLPAAAIFLFVVVLNGCAIVPGQRMDEGALQSDDSHVQLVQITPELIESTQVQPGTIPQELLSFQPQDYRIAAGDTLYITVWDHPELTSPAGSQQQTVANGRLVRPDGTLFYPYAGTIKAEGLTVEDLRQLLTKKLGSFVRDPQVDVNVVGYGGHRITLEGAFQHTDAQVLNSVPLTLSQAIGLAGVDTQQADLSGFTLTRDGKTYNLDLTQINQATAGQTIYLKPGDTLFLPYNDNKEVYVVGEVVRPQAITFKTTALTLTQALGRAGGLSPVTSSGEAVYVIRGSKKLSQTPAQVFHLSARSASSYALADNFRVQPGDVVFVGAAAITKWNRVLSQLLPLSGLIYQAAGTADRVDNR
ncbi:polysaccharide biosynthesis/export family protein [Frateuria hangzhouensis]|uniref:polysaccharide biosynthesis/export family protein n=1 Tax=Frateuria hangzhouensis TaxID=2995589 RepID=UPI002260A7A2|nr:polysaccharide biosynthesis/export family protein [Frateuria sp. STR12]MCX7515047.1 polysaccharide biosynthesis/export family protein [Frateuria sp. STR12]